MITAEKLEKAAEAAYRAVDLAPEIQRAITACAALSSALELAEYCPVKAVFGLGIEIGYLIAKAEAEDE